MSRPMFEKIIAALPRDKLEDLAKDYASNERPWHADRKWLESQVIAADKTAMREELLEYLKVCLIGTVARRKVAL